MTSKATVVVEDRRRGDEVEGDLREEPLDRMCRGFLTKVVPGG